DGLSIHWAANCNNDFVMLDIPAQVPEPSVLALMMFGLAGLGLMRRKV
ncbi:MAG: PEP-CTERM sorting domain-containing protein, partial [Gammaproteobacteria bacterium]|nr:PEP-CTERM sorting domain-containing protein [Gammaproteobacteria bacterium]